MALAVSAVAPGAGAVASVLMNQSSQIGQPPTADSGALPAGQHESQVQPLLAIASSGLTPQQISTAYGINQIGFGAIKGDGTGETIAIVDAYDDPDLVDSTSAGFKSSDLALFDQRFGLPDPPSFEKLGQDGSANLPAADTSGLWEKEEALDVEWAHAIAPGASIILIECNTYGLGSLLSGVKTAAGLPGVSVVSMSFGSSEFSGEKSYDNYFTTPSGHQGVTFVASTGDNGSPGEYPACSPNVLAVGGTSLNLNGDNTYQSESAWSCSGGGTSTYESEPSYQVGVQSTGQRTIPDVAFDADPMTGVPIYDSYGQANPCFEEGGTSLAAPCWAGLIAIADQGRVAMGGTTLDGATQTLPALYSLPSGDFHAINSGSNGAGATLGYNQVTGLGSPNASLLIPGLAAYQLPGEQPVAPKPTAPKLTATKLVVTSQLPSSVTAGTALNFTITAEDGSGNVASSFNGSLTVALGANPSGGTLYGTLTVTASQGVATFGLTILKAGAGYRLQISGGGLTPALTSSLNVTPAAAARLVVISGPPTNVIVGSSFQLTVAATDIYGNVATSYSGNISVVLAGNRGKGKLHGTVSERASSGVASFSSLTESTVGNGYSLTVTGTGLIATTTPSFNVSLAPRITVKTRAARTLAARAVAKPKTRA